MKSPSLEDFLREKGADVKAALDPSKNSSNVEKLAGVAVVGVRWIVEKALAELAKKPKS